jgi:hypothetical protein
MSSGTAIVAFPSASRLVSRALGDERRARKQHSIHVQKTTSSEVAAELDPGLSRWRRCGLIARADHKENE